MREMCCPFAWCAQMALRIAQRHAATTSPLSTTSTTQYHHCCRCCSGQALEREIAAAHLKGVEVQTDWSAASPVAHGAEMSPAVGRVTRPAVCGAHTTTAGVGDLAQAAPSDGVSRQLIGSAAAVLATLDVAHAVCPRRGLVPNAVPLLSPPCTRLVPLPNRSTTAGRSWPPQQLRIQRWPW